MNAPNFTAALRDINEIEAEKRDHELALIDLWRADVDMACEAAAPKAGQLAKQASAAIVAAEPLSDAEVVLLCSSLYRALQSGAHIERTRNALACLSDVVAAFKS
jgi:hypothetical protein